MSIPNPLDILPVYEGKDPNTSEEGYCENCSGREGDLPDGGPSSSPIHLMRCSRCKCVKYCSAKCQKEHWNDHKDTCKSIRKAEKETEREAEKLRNCSECFGCPLDPPQNLFERENVGRFWGIFETRDYMRARCRLADEIYDIAYWQETYELWNKCLSHYLELLRLCESDNLGVRFKVPFILLYLNRDDDAYSFCRYWVNLDENYEEREARHASASEGDWIYPREADCRYLDFFEQCPNATRKYIGLPFLVAVFIIKLRLVAAFDEKKRRGVQQDESLEAVARIESNRQQIQRLMDQIDKNNPAMLPSILNPTPFKSQPLPDFTSPGHPSEAYSVLNNCNRAWVRVPGSEQLLVRRFGTETPTYNHNLSL